MNNHAAFKNAHDFSDTNKVAVNSKIKGMNPSTDNLVISIHEDLGELESQWRELEMHSNISIYQKFDWIDACLHTLETNLNTKPQIVTGHMNGKLVFVLPLVLQGGLMPKYRWIGGNHSNYNLALVDHQYRKTLGTERIVSLFQDICDALPDTGYLKLCCQPFAWNDQANPLKALSHQSSTNVAFGMDLSGGFANVLALGNGKRKRKKFRSQSRAVEELGGAKLVEAKNETQAHAILNCFYRQKSERFRDQGLKDVFGGPDTQHFLEQMTVNSLGANQPLLKLYALEVGGKYRAICGGGVIGQHFSAYFTSFANDELAHISPGEMLLYLLVEELCEAGFQSLDLGCGEERYKRSWCTKTHEMFDVILPVSTLSHGSVFLHRFYLDAKRNIRENEQLWGILKRMRMMGSKLTGKS